MRVVLLGPDGAGKSTVLAGLRRRGHRVLTTDAAPGLAGLRRWWLEEVLPRTPGRYDVTTSCRLLDPFVDHLARPFATGPGDGFVVDSYYYKLLVKLDLFGIVCPQVAARWRRLPRPDHVVYVDVPARVSWVRKDRGRELNAFEHYGTAPRYAQFARLQRDLRTGLLREVRGLPLTVVNGAAAPEQLLTKVEEVVAHVGTQGLSERGGTRPAEVDGRRERPGHGPASSAGPAGHGQCRQPVRTPARLRLGA